MSDPREKVWPPVVFFGPLAVCEKKHAHLLSLEPCRKCWHLRVGSLKDEPGKKRPAVTYGWAVSLGGKNVQVPLY